MKEYNKQPSVFLKSIHSGKWMAVGMAVQKILSLGTFLVLARFLKPVDYGIIAVILMITVVVDRLTSSGLATALVQRGDDMEPYFDAVWTIDILKSFGLALLIFFMAQPISVFFNMPQALSLVQACGLLVILTNLSNIRQVYVLIALDFKKIFWRDTLAQVAYVLGALGWIFLVRADVWALLVGHMCRIFTGMVISYVIYPAWPRFSLDFFPLKKFVDYSKWIAGQNILDYVSSLADQFFVGRLLGPERLGFYSKANDLAALPRASLTSIISKVGFYSYNLVQDEVGKIQEGFMKSLDLVLMLIMPFNFFIMVEGGTIISVLLGPQWLGVVVPLKILAFSNIFIALYSIFYPLFNSIGRPDINFKTTLIKIILIGPLFYWGIKVWETNGAAFMATIISFILLIFVAYQGKRVLHLGRDKVLPSFYHIGLSLLPVAILAIGFRPLIHSFGSDYLICGWVALLAIFYSILFWLFGRFFPKGPRSTVEVIFSEVTSNWRS